MLPHQPSFLEAASNKQQARNNALLNGVPYLGAQICSDVFSFPSSLSFDSLDCLKAIQTEAARIAIAAVGKLAEIKEIDHLGGGLGIIDPLSISMLLASASENIAYTIEHAHTSIGYYALLAAFGYVKPEDVVSQFRQGIQFPGHVTWLPGGTQLNGGRLGVMVPAAVGQSLAMRAKAEEEAWVIVHCGDAGWIPAINSFAIAAKFGAPVTFIMDRNRTQLSGPCQSVYDLNPAEILNGVGINIIEINSLHHTLDLWKALQNARELAREGRPSLIYPVGYSCQWDHFGAIHGISQEALDFAKANRFVPTQEVKVPGSIMGYRHPRMMLEGVALLNGLPGGKNNHDGNLIGENVGALLEHPILRNDFYEATLQVQKNPAKVYTTTRPSPGSANLIVNPAKVAELAAHLPTAGTTVTARAGSEAAYKLLAAEFGPDMFVISCDVDPSTKVAAAAKLLPSGHHFEVGVQEQEALLMADGIAVVQKKGFVVVSSFAAFLEGIAREGIAMLQYQRNLNGRHEGLNVTYHFSHVGSCTGRDNLSGWSLNWINLALDHMSLLERVYAPADARAAAMAVLDAASRYGAHIIAIPRDNLPILTCGDGKTLYDPEKDWGPVSICREAQNAQQAVLAIGAPAFVAVEAFEQGAAEIPFDVIVINGLPVPPETLHTLLARYPQGVVTIEDGLIGNPQTGMRGFAGLVASYASDAGIRLAPIGITDATVAPSLSHLDTWRHFGITKEDIIDALRKLRLQ